MDTIRHTPNLILAAAAILVLGACSNSPTLYGPITINSEPTVYTFEDSARAGGSSWELCFEFDLNDDSHHATDIVAHLIAVDGSVTPLVTTADRRGERVVCLIAALDGPQLSYKAVELSSQRPLKVRLLRGGAR